MGLYQLFFGCLQTVLNKAKPAAKKGVNAGADAIEGVLDNVIDNVVDTIKPIANKITGQDLSSNIDGLVKPALNNLIHAQVTVVENNIIDKIELVDIHVLHEK